MALSVVKKRKWLDAGNVLSPERYDPRRQINAGEKNIPLEELIQTVTETVSAKSCNGPYIVLDTSNAREGVVVCRRQQTVNIGSTKKVVRPGDVVVSRLRPYLRQVAYIDGAIPGSNGAKILCSTEFFVLRSLTDESIAFITPFLLSSQVQEVLSAAQEGGHHPRVDEATVRGLPVPKSWYEKRREKSSCVEEMVKELRNSEDGIETLKDEVEKDLA